MRKVELMSQIKLCILECCLYLYFMSILMKILLNDSVSTSNCNQYKDFVTYDYFTLNYVPYNWKDVISYDILYLPLI